VDKFCVRREDIQNYNKTDKVLFVSILVLTVLIITAAGFIYIQKNKIMSMFEEKNTQTDTSEKALMGKVISANKNSVIIQVEKDNIPTEYEILLDSDTKIYQDYDTPTGNPIQKDINYIQNKKIIVVSLKKINSSLFAETVHIMPEPGQMPEEENLKEEDLP